MTNILPSMPFQIPAERFINVSVRLHVWLNSTAAELIFMKCYVEGFYWSLSYIRIVIKIRQQYVKFFLRFFAWMWRGEEFTVRLGYRVTCVNSACYGYIGYKVRRSNSGNCDRNVALCVYFIACSETSYSANLDLCEAGLDEIKQN